MRRHIIQSLGLLLIIFSFLFIINDDITKDENNDLDVDSKNNNFVLKSSGSWDLNRILIDNNWSDTSATYGWCYYKDGFYIIENVTIDRGIPGNAIEIENTEEPFIVRNCAINDSKGPGGRGVSLDNVTNGNFENNNLSYNVRAFFLWNCENITLKDNRINKNNYGIEFFQNNNNNTIYNNTIYENRYGIYINDNSNDNNITKNMIKNNDKEGIMIKDNSENNVVSSNYVLNNGKYFSFYSGLVVDSNNNNITHNFINNSGASGIWLGGSSNNLIFNNTSNNNDDDGIALNNADFNNISYNFASSNGESGIDISGGSTNNNVTNNRLNFNYEWGIKLAASSLNSLYNNKMIDCGIGLGTSANTHIIDKSNLVNNSPVHYFKNKIGLKPINFTNAGQSILANCRDSLVSNTVRISLYQSENITVYNNIDTSKFYIGIYLYSGQKNNISSNILSNKVRGIYSSSCEYTNISNNNIINSSNYGIYMASDDNKIDNNEIYNSSMAGIYLWCDRNNLTGNILTKCNIELRGTINEDRSHLVDTSNTVNGKNVYYYIDKVGLTPENFTDSGQSILVNCRDSIISDSGCIGLYYGQNNTITDNNNISNINNGIIIFQSNDNYVYNNTINNNSQYGIYVFYADRNNVTFNNISNNLGAIHLISSEYTNVTNNHLINNLQYGIYFDYSSHYSMITNNTIMNNAYGMRFRKVDSSRISLCNIINNSRYGVFIEDDISDYNLFYNNSFVGNLVNAIDDSDYNSNYWNNTDIGNYWDDYGGSDDNDDGIGDTPYLNIQGSSGNIDYLPIWDDGIELESVSVSTNGNGNGGSATKKKFDIIEFLMSPLGLIIVGSSVGIALIVLIIIKKGSSRKSIEKEREFIQEVIREKWKK